MNFSTGRELEQARGGKNTKSRPRSTICVKKRQKGETALLGSSPLGPGIAPRFSWEPRRLLQCRTWSCLSRRVGAELSAVSVKPGSAAGPGSSGDGRVGVHVVEQEKFGASGEAQVVLEEAKGES